MKKILFLSLSALFLFVTLSGCGLTTTAATTTTTTITALTEEIAAIKDETVYLTADANGVIGRMIVINRLADVEPGIYVDRGRFTAAFGLSGDETVTIGDNGLRLNIDSHYEEYYYRAELGAGYAAPFAIDIAYELDGEPVDVGEIVGTAGVVTLKMTVSVNPEAEAYFRDKYLCNLQLKLDSGKTRILQATGGTTILAAGVYTIAFLVLPGTSKTFSVTVDTDAFGIGGIEASFTRFDPAMLGDDFAGFGAAMADLILGLEALRDGQVDLADGLADVRAAVDALLVGSADITGGIGAYQDAANLLLASLSELSDHITALSLGASGLQDAGSALLEGYAGLMGIINDVAATFAALHPEDEALLTKLTTMTQTAAAIEAALSAYVGGVDSLSSNLAILAAGLAQLEAGTELLNAGLTELVQASGNIMDGLAMTGSGFDVIVAALPAMIDAQSAMMAGLSDAITGLAFLDIVPGDYVSFTDPDNPVPGSVQFIYSIPGF